MCDSGKMMNVSWESDHYSVYEENHHSILTAASRQTVIQMLHIPCKTKYSYLLSIPASRQFVTNAFLPISAKQAEVLPFSSLQ